MAEQTVTETGNQANQQIQKLIHTANQVVSTSGEVVAVLLFLYVAIKDRKEELDEVMVKGLEVIVDLLGDRAGETEINGREIAAELQRLAGEVTP